MMWGNDTPTNTEKPLGLGTVWLAAESELTTEWFASPKEDAAENLPQRMRPILLLYQVDGVSK